MIRHFRRAVVVVCGAAALVLGGGTVAAAGVTPLTGSAPASHGSASAVDLEALKTCISCTTSEAGTHRPQGRSSAIRLLGREISGGDSVSNASQKGALVALPVNPLLNVAIAHWRTFSGVDGERSTSYSHSRAALVDLALLGETQRESLLTAALLESTSNATYTGAQSQGDAADNGADLTALHGTLVLILLHSETSSDGPGSSYLLSVNGNRLRTSGQTGNGGGIPVTIPGVLTLTLLATGAAVR
jgi:hypothetical protein